jgi:hypothetical protein
MKSISQTHSNGYPPAPTSLQVGFYSADILFHSVSNVPPIFFLQVKKNRTTPFWLHPVLQSHIAGPKIISPSAYSIIDLTRDENDSDGDQDHQNRYADADEDEDDD